MTLRMRLFIQGSRISLLIHDKHIAKQIVEANGGTIRARVPRRGEGIDVYCGVSRGINLQRFVRIKKT